MSLSCDVVVVGGGLAGVTAARDLARRGTRVLLVEARDRLGGRTETQRLAGRDVETGGTYFHWFQAAIWTQVHQYELELVERPLADRFLMGVAGEVVAMEPAEVDERLRRVLPLFWGDPAYAEALARPFAVRSHPGAAAIDAVSVEDRLRALHLDPVDDAVLRGIFTDFGRPLEDVSLAWVLQRAASAVWSYEAFDAMFAVYRLTAGMRGLIEAMVADGGFEVRLSSPVVSVTHDEHGGRVELHDGSVLSARAIVVATPVNVWRTMSFSPTLPELHTSASAEGVAAPGLTNVVMHVRGLEETLNVFAPYGDEPFDFLFTYDRLDDGQLLAGYSMNGRIRMADGRQRIRDALRRVVPDAELVDVVGHDWATDPFALGGNGSLQVGQLTRFAGALDEPVGRLFFASGDIAPQFAGFLTGAVESGIRAAHRAHRALAQER